jgi:AraC family transcriptional activator of pobA
MTGKIISTPSVIYQILHLKDIEVQRASQRIAFEFLDLLEKQFQINDASSPIEFRFPSQFAAQLNVHVNHLNRALKENLNKTTSEIISIRVLYEAKRRLAESNWDISDISYALGFRESTHFNNFFKKRMNVSPTEFRQRSIHDGRWE